MYAHQQILNRVIPLRPQAAIPVYPYVKLSFMEPEKQQEIFEDKYQHKLGMSYEDWLATAPETEDQAYEKLQELDQEIKQINDLLSDQPSNREELEDERDRLKLEYDLIEEMFGLDLDD